MTRWPAAGAEPRRQRAVGRAGVRGEPGGAAGPVPLLQPHRNPRARGTPSQHRPSHAASCRVMPSHAESCRVSCRVITSHAVYLCIVISSQPRRNVATSPALASGGGGVSRVGGCRRRSATRHTPPEPPPLLSYIRPLRLAHPVVAVGQPVGEPGGGRLNRSWAGAGSPPRVGASYNAALHHSNHWQSSVAGLRHGADSVCRLRGSSGSESADQSRTEPEPRSLG